MRIWFRMAFLLALLAGGAALAQNPAAVQRPFAQLIELWTRQLDRISTRADQPGLLPAEIDSLREETAFVRAAAVTQAQLARGDLADTRRLLAPLEVKPDADPTPETDAIKAERQRLTELATISENRAKQCEVIVARTDQLLERMTKLRTQVVLKTLLHRGPSPLSPRVWTRLPQELGTAVTDLSAALSVWGRGGLNGLAAGNQDLLPLAAWAVLTLVLWWMVRGLRRRFGRRGDVHPGPGERMIGIAIDGLGRMLIPILTVWLIGRVLAASQPPSPIDKLLPELIDRAIIFLLVIGVTATALTPYRPAWRIMPFSDASDAALSNALRRLLAIGLSADFVLVALVQGGNREALTAVGALAVVAIVAALALPALANRSWQSARPDGSDQLSIIGGTWWSITRLILSIVVLSAVGCAALGYATLAGQLQAAIAQSCLLVALALVAHRLVADLIEAVAAADTASGRWVRVQLGLAADAPMRGTHVALLLVDIVLVIVLVLAIPTVWGADTDAGLRAMEQLLYGIKVGGVTISLGNIALAMAAFGICIVLARLLRRIVRDSVMPTVEAPMPLRQSIDAGLNYAGVIIAILVGIGALGIDFTNLAIVLGALSVGIGLGLQNIANNVISGLILLVERPIKSGDWVLVGEHEGFVRRINIRATEIETFQRTHVIVPNSLFLQNPVVNRTYSDTSSRIDMRFTVTLNTDVAKMESLLRDAALAHPRVLRVPEPIVRFVQIGTTGLDFALFVFVARLEDRQVVTNDLNGAILARLIEEKFLDPRPAADVRLRDLDVIKSVLKQDSGAPGHGPATPTG